MAVVCLFALSFGFSTYLLQSSTESSEQVLLSSDSVQPPAGNFVQEPLDRSSSRSSFWQRKRPALAYNKRVSPLVLGSVAEALGPTWKSVVRIVHHDEQVALGTIVNSDGWIITKASQLPNSSTIQCNFYDYRSFPAEIVTKVPNLDLALLRVQAKNLSVPQWLSDLPARGKFVATIDPKATPASLGVVSTGVQRIPYQKSVLGVHLTNSIDGAAVTHVLRGSGGARAGLQIGDNIYEANGIAVTTHQGFKQAIRDAKGGDYVSLKVSRGQEKLSVEAQLMDLADELLDDTEMEVNGEVSARSSNFERVLLHDSFLFPNQCGGPLVNLDGKVVGINIARAGRVTSYALPADVVLPVVNDLIQNAKLVSRSAESRDSDPSVR